MAGEGEKKGVDVETLAKTVEALAGTVNGLHGNLKTIADSHTELMEAMKKGQESKPAKKDEKVDIDLETASRTDFAKFILGEVQKVVKGAVEPIKQKADEVDTKVTTGSLKRTVEELKKGEHPDLEEWAPELKALIEESPGLSLQRAIKLVKEENPKKAKDLSDKFAEERTKAKEEAEKARKAERKNFGGIAPGGSSTKSEKAGKMSQDEAAEAAWEEVESQLDDPSILESS